MYTLINKEQLNFNRKGNMEVRQIFLKKFCQRCAKAKKVMKVMIEKKLFFRCQKQLGQATLNVSITNKAKKERITKARTVNYILLLSLI